MPGLDFSNLKHVKDYKDWYAYAKKLEDALTLLRQRITELESEKDQLQDKADKQALHCEQLHQDNLNIADELRKAKLLIKTFTCTTAVTEVAVQ